MYIVFEGIGGSGKTALAARVAAALRARGVRVERVRDGGAEASRALRAIHALARDPSNLALTARAELLLGAARAAQDLDERIRTARTRADVVIAERSCYGVEALGVAGRDLPVDQVRAIVDASAAGFWPDLVFLLDVDPFVARGRRKVGRLERRKTVRRFRVPAREALAGEGLAYRLRDGYRTLAEREPDRWAVLEADVTDLDELARLAADTIERARADGPAAALAQLRGEPQPARARTALGPSPAPDDPHAALARFLRAVDGRATREPALAAHLLAGLHGPAVDERRLALATHAPRLTALGLAGLTDPVSWQLRRQLMQIAPREVARSLSAEAAEALDAWKLRELLAEAAPHEVAESLAGIGDETAWALRATLENRAPEAVLSSLALLDSARAWQARRRWRDAHGGDGAAIDRRAAAALAHSVTGLEDERAFHVREQALQVAPVAVIASLTSLTGERAWQWRERFVGDAPKPVLATIAGIDDARAWSLRAATAGSCPEALASMVGLDHPVAWELREEHWEQWPASAVESLGVRVSGPRGEALLRRALAAFPDDLALLKRAAAIVTGASLTPHVLAA
jgi:dTMP kinase